MSWRLAQSLATLREEFDAAFPDRSKVSDGTIGDRAHAARASRHNPNRHGVVTALDVTHDPAHGLDVHAIARKIAANPHPQLRYIVSNGHIAHVHDGFAWRHYGGSNPHTKHAHFAVGVGGDGDPRPPYDSTVPWGVAAPRQPQDAGPRAYAQAIVVPTSSNWDRALGDVLAETYDLGLLETADGRTFWSLSHNVAAVITDWAGVVGAAKYKVDVNPPAVRIAGEDRWETSEAVAAFIAAHPPADWPRTGKPF